MWWDETGLMWVNPSPNLRNPTAALLYPAIGLLEATNVSVGRGTDQPFELFGAPWIDGRKLAAALNDAKLPGLRFVPITFEAKASKFVGLKCQGVYVEVIDRNAFEPMSSGFAIARHLTSMGRDNFQASLIEKMLQNTSAMTILTATEPASADGSWRANVAEFRANREKYLLYR
jgi:uncharacterized protein YbbC (DUF1343 family)